MSAPLPALSSRDARPWFPGTRTVVLPPDEAPRLHVVVDTEEEFDWYAPFDPRQTSVTAMAAIGRFQALCDEVRLAPTYVIDYPIASQPEGYRDLAEYAAAGRATIGAHLHAWVSPPHDEDLDGAANRRHSFQGNLPRALERDKLARLTETIAQNLGVRPTVHKAGRYGFGPNTASVLAELGYTTDCSISAGFDWSALEGPDFQHFTSAPFTFGAGLLALPASGGFVGAAPSGLRRALYGLAARPRLAPLRLKGVLARLGLSERILLSPEGYQFEDLARFTRAALARGERFLTLTLHSPSLVPGHTPYVRTSADRDQLLEVVRRYLQFFLGELGGRPTTPAEAHSLLRPLTP